VTEVRSYRDLVVGQKGMELAVIAYSLAKSMPKTEEYRLTSQLLRAATSVPANIAEGNARGTRKDYANFISVARGSVAEVQTLLELAVRTRLLSSDETSAAAQLADELGRMLKVLRERLASTSE
jgi:four helix bundle protein